MNSGSWKRSAYSESSAYDVEVQMWHENRPDCLMDHWTVGSEWRLRNTQTIGVSFLSESVNKKLKKDKCRDFLCQQDVDTL